MSKTYLASKEDVDGLKLQMGTEDISGIGDGTAKGAIKALNSNLSIVASGFTMQRINGTSFASVLSGVENKVVFIAFTNPTDNPFSFQNGWCIAMQCGLLTSETVFQLIGACDNLLEAKRITIST